MHSFFYFSAPNLKIICALFLPAHRYDGRGHLYDLASHDAERVDRSVQLTEEEEAVEKACDEERYLELHTDVQEVAMYEGKEKKIAHVELSTKIDIYVNIRNIQDKSAVIMRNTVYASLFSIISVFLMITAEVEPYSYFGVHFRTFVPNRSVTRKRCQF